METSDANVVAVSRNGSRELTALADHFKGRLIILKGDVGQVDTNQVSVLRASGSCASHS